MAEQSTAPTAENVTLTEAEAQQRLEALWGCGAGDVFEGYGVMCRSSAHTYAMWGGDGCAFAAEAAECLYRPGGEQG